MRRRAGILLHPTSLPGPYGMGDLGPGARRWLAWLESAGQGIWQFLPLNPTGGGGSPYSSPSAFARNPLLLSLEDLADDGWIEGAPPPWGDAHHVDFEGVISHRRPYLRQAAERVVAAVDLDAWAEQHPWARSWALFRAIADTHGTDWTTWPEELRDRDAQALAAAGDAEVLVHLALQWLFLQQWERLRRDARRRGIALWGDLPIFVTADSCDTWVHRDLFRLDERGRPEVVSGVPPDAFSASGQKWGHPLFDEAAHAAEGHDWWARRLASLMEIVDTVRLDHFRGLEAAWEVPTEAPDARTGRWIPGAGKALLQALQDRFGRVPLIAEDLGVITPEVEALRDAFDLPGMAVLQFAFCDATDPAAAANPYLPHHHRENQVVYTGTHDNDTTIGWYDASDEATRDHVRRYLSVDGRDIAWDLARAAWRSVARSAIVPMQDVLSLGGQARMNVPGRAEDNWSWRMGAEALNPVLARRLRAEAVLTCRVGLSR